MHLRVIILLILLFSNLITYSQNIKIISWNLKELGDSKDAAEIKFIAQTLKDADIIAIQEVVTGPGGAKAVAKIILELNNFGSKWDYAISEPTVSSSHKTERYAFLWKTHQVKLKGNTWLLNGNFIDLVEREPYGAVFQYNQTEMMLVNFHADSKTNQPEKEIKFFKYIPQLYPDFNIVFLGDFNLSQSHSVFNPLKKIGFQPALVNQKTSLRQKCLSDGCLSAELDNIFYNQNKFRVISKGVIHFYKTFDDIQQARLISDHLPLYVILVVKE